MARDEPVREIDEEPEPHEWLFLLLNHVESQVAFGDTKAGLLLTADSILLAGLATVIAGENPMLPGMTAGTKVLVAVAFIALCTGLVLALQAIIPSRKNLLNSGEPSPPGAMVLFSRIAEPAIDVYVTRALAARRGVLNRDIAQTVHGKARWARRKFWFLYAAVLGTTIGVGAAFGAVAVETMARIGG